MSLFDPTWWIEAFWHLIRRFNLQILPLEKQIPRQKQRRIHLFFSSVVWTQLPPALLTLAVGTSVSSDTNSHGDAARTQVQHITGCSVVRCNMAPHFLFERQLQHCRRQGVPCNPWIASECSKVGVIFTLEIQWSFMQRCACWIGPLFISLQGLHVLCLSWYLQSSAAKQNEKKGNGCAPVWWKSQCSPWGWNTLLIIGCLSLQPNSTTVTSLLQPLACQPAIVQRQLHHSTL